MIAARWIKTPRVEIQWGQNSILHRNFCRRSNQKKCYKHVALELYFICVTYGLPYFSFRFVSLRFRLFFSFSFVSFLFSLFLFSFFLRFVFFFVSFRNFSPCFLFVFFLSVSFRFFSFFFRFSVYRYPGTTIWFWGNGGLLLFGNRYSDLKMLKINNLSSSGKKIGEKCQSFQSVLFWKENWGKVPVFPKKKSARFNRIFQARFARIINSETMVCSYPPLNTYIFIMYLLVRKYISIYTLHLCSNICFKMANIPSFCSILSADVPISFA